MKTYVRFATFFGLKIIARLALQGLNLSIQFNFNLALSDIIANETLGESVSPDKHCFQLYASKLFALTSRLGLSGSNVAFHFCLFRFSSIRPQAIGSLFPRCRSESSVHSLWMEVSK